MLRRKQVCTEAFMFDASKLGIDSKNFSLLFDEWIEEEDIDDKYFNNAGSYDSPAGMLDFLKGKSTLYYSFMSFVFKRAMETVDGSDY